MKSFRNSVGVLLCTCLLAASPAALPHAAALTTTSYEEALKTAPHSVKKTVENTLEFFGLSDETISFQSSTSGGWRVTMTNTADASSSGSIPTSVTLLFSKKDQKLTQMTAYWAKQPTNKTADLEGAVSEAQDFAQSVIGENYDVSSQATITFHSKAEVSIYPIVKDIPVQKPVGRIIVDEAGHVISFHRLDSYIDERLLPSKADVLSTEKAKQAFSDQLKLELAYDDEQGQYQYVAMPYPSIDAKTGKAFLNSVQSVNTSFTVGTAKKELAAVSANRAKEMAKTFLGLQADQVAVSTSRESHPNETPITIHTASDKNGSFEIRVNEKTGELQTIREKNRGRGSEASPSSVADAKKQALSFIEQYIPLNEGDYMLRESTFTQHETAYRLSLYPSVNGVRTTKPIVVLTMDLLGNTVTNVSTRAFAAPSAEAIPAFISAEEAKKQWVKALEPKLNYVFADPEDDHAILAYVASISAQSHYVDAISGTVSSYK
ncbi:hypothetical protein [Brevibacillus choshinensis]|uniref:Peptidase n=1 Tax=Brevibacillus choshinensis TaxID=54911 RepID=A0ABX7FTD5_BRECH|nr:hypothetical protein [Brevibacillus choshinensis]QRG69498.1 hypothetical protein JNE38_10430 [Brevibacillus choshinensis]